MSTGSNSYKAFIISIDRYADRRPVIIEQLKGTTMDYEFYNGVDGNNLQLVPVYNDQIILINDIGNKKSYVYNTKKRLINEVMNNNQLGCTLSHIELYKNLLNDQCDSYFIIEDDATMMVAPQKVKEYLSRLPSSNTYDIAMLCYSDYFPFKKREQINSHYFIPEKNFFNRTTCYIVTKRGANKLICANYPYIELPADDLLSNLYMFTFDFQVIASNEALFIDRLIKDTIRTG